MTIKATDPMAMLQEIEQMLGAVRAAPLFFPDHIATRRPLYVLPAPVFEFREPEPHEVRYPKLTQWPAIGPAHLARIEIDVDMGDDAAPTKRPRWGQPGRHRRRKARQAARRRNEDRQRARAMMARLEAADPRRELAAMHLRRERAAVEATLRPAPEGPLFEAGTASDACQILPIVTHEHDGLD